MSGLALLVAMLAMASGPAEPVLSLEGDWLLASGDDPSWARPELAGNAGWRVVHLPSRHTQSRYPAVVWYRKAFELPPPLLGHDLGLLLGLVENCDEVYLNGRRIGGEGSFGDDYILPFRSGRLYHLPADLLRKDGATNVLAIRVKLFAPVGGISRAPIKIGPYNALQIEHQAHVHRFRQRETALLTFMAMLLVGALWLCVAGRFSGESVSFAVFVLALGLNALLESTLFYAAGLQGRWSADVLILLYYLEPVPAVCFVSLFYRNRVTPLAKATCVGFAVLNLPFLLTGTVDHQALTDSAFLLLFVGSILLGLHYGIRAASRERTIENLIVLLGLVLLAAGLAWDILGYLGLNPVAGQDSLLSYAGLGALGFCMASALSYRYARMRGELQLLSLGVLSRRDEERSRIASDLHDGLAQELLAIKMDVELMQRGQGAGTAGVSARCAQASEKLGRSVDELYQIIHDLRPLSLEKLGFREAVAALAQDVVQAGRTVDVRIDEGLLLKDPVETQLYRILQEAVRNAVQHGEAPRIQVSVARKGGRVTLRVSDDGRGFDSAHLSRRRSGVGLLAMKERTRQLGGTLDVRSAPGKGTMIQLEVPVS